MQKVNARLHPADKKEIGTLSSKEFICLRCNHKQHFENIEFGETRNCPKCGAEMYELFKKEGLSGEFYKK